MDASIELRRLAHLILLTEELNFSRAAARANLSQTALSRSIQALEADCGLLLFDRSTRSVRLTAAGQQVAARARALLAQARDMRNDIAGMAQAIGGELSFGASLLGVDGALQRVLPQLVRDSPGLTLNVEVSQWKVLLQRLEQEQIEFFVGFPGLLGKDPRFLVTPLASQRASMFCRAGHPLLRAGAPAPRDLLGHPWATVQLPDISTRRIRQLFGAPPDGDLPAILSCGNQALLRELALNTDALLFTWAQWLQADLASGAIVDLADHLSPALPPGLLQLSCAIVHRAGRTPSPAARRLMSMVVG